MKFNPFRPNSIVSPGMFAGRAEELEALDRALFQTKNGNPWHFLIHGERGIGKTSLMLVVDYMSRGQLKGPSSGIKYNFITVKVEIDPSITYSDIVRKIEREIITEVKNKDAFRSTAKNIFDFLSNWEVGGIKYNKPQTGNSPDYIEDLCELASGVVTRLSTKASVDGIIIILDEADNAREEAQIGEFIKLTTERLTRIGCENILIGVSGISSVVEKIKASHPSAARILNHIKLEPLLESERKEVLTLGLKQANDKSPGRITMTPEAMDWIAKYSEGYPHFIQQYASSAFDTDNDNNIDIEDVKYGAFKENGALEQLGVHYFNEMYSDQINSDEYRKVLQVMAESTDKYVSRQDIARDTELKKTTLGNALQALKSKKIIFPHPEKQGYYKLPSDSFALWIRMKLKSDKQQDKKAF